MAFSVTQYDTKRNCYADRGIINVGAKYDHILESHMDAFNIESAKGAHIIIKAGYAADSADKGIVAVLDKYFDLRASNGYNFANGFTNMEDALTRASYRLVEFGFITNNKDRTTFITKMDDIAKDIAKVMVKTGGRWLLIAGHGAGDPGALSLDKKYTEAALVRQLNAKIEKYAKELANPKPAPKPAAKAAPKPAPVKDSAPKPKTYKAKKGDTQYGIAKKFGIKVADLQAWNKLKTTAVFVDQVFIVSKPSTTVKAAAKKKVASKTVKKAPPKVVNRRTYAELVAKTRSYKGKAVDFDGYYGFQCADLACDYIFYASKGTYRAWGNARDLINNKFPDGWKIYANTPELVPKVGWIAVYSRDWANNAYGHVSLVYDKPTMYTMQVVEQNWDGNANTAAKVRTDNYSGVSHFIAPAVA